jgi:hypothetical protein
MAKKRNFIVVPREPKVMQEGLDIDGQHISFNGKTAKNITDPGLAEAIEQKYGLKAKGSPDIGRVWTERDEKSDNFFNYHDASGVHKYFFGPTRAFSEAWDRIFGGKDASPK